MIKAVIFDLGRVIVPFDFKRGYQALAPYCAYPASEIPKRLNSTDLVRRFESGKVEAGDFFRQISQMLELRVSYDRFCELWSSIFLPETLIPEQMIEGLRRRCRVLLLSNTNAIHYGMLEANYPILRHFDGYILSHMVGAMKPAPEIYLEAVRQAACAPEECFFTDDMADYVDAARRLGIDAVQFQSAEQIEAELNARGIAWR